MFDVASRSDRPLRQRAVGSLRVAFKTRGEESAIDRLYQHGCLKARFPARERGAWITAVTLNSSGGVVGGDRLDQHFTFAAGTRVSVCAQAAERFYRADPETGPAELRCDIELEPDARVEWLPQETILFDGFALRRRLDVAMAANAYFLGVEMLVFGRAAMNETVRWGSLRDLIRVRRDGALIWHDAVRIEGAVDAILARKAVANGARGVATVIYAAPDAEARLPLTREACDVARANGVEAACSAFDSLLVLRVLAPNSLSLRQGVTTILTSLRDGRPLPRVWLC
jgi:urease accessory protein